MAVKEIVDAVSIDHVGLDLIEYIKGLDDKVATGEMATKLADLRMAHLDLANRYAEAVTARVHAARSARPVRAS